MKTKTYEIVLAPTKYVHGKPSKQVFLPEFRQIQAENLKEVEQIADYLKEDFESRLALANSRSKDPSRISWKIKTIITELAY